MPSRTKKAAAPVAAVDPSSSESEPQSEPQSDVDVVDGEGSDSDGSDHDSGGESASQSGGDEEEDEDKDSLDSSAPRKRRRVSPGLDEEEEEDEDEDDMPKAPPVSFSAPSRIRKAPAAGTITQAPTAEVTAPKNDTIVRPTTVPLDLNTTFESLQVQPWLVQSLVNMAIMRPTGIQKGCIPEILKGRDCIGGSRTGSGKTVAFAVPILQKWAQDPSAIFALVLTPTR